MFALNTLSRAIKLKEKELSLEEAIKLANKVKNWKLIKKECKTMPDDNFFGERFASEDVCILKYSGTLEKILFFLTSEHQDSTYLSSGYQEYRLSVNLDGSVVAEYETRSLKTLFNKIDLEREKKEEKEKKELMTERLNKIRSYL